MNRYQNTVLTVIAVALVAITAKMYMPPSYAAGETLTRVQICDETGRCAKIDQAYDALVAVDPNYQN